MDENLQAMLAAISEQQISFISTFNSMQKVKVVEKDTAVPVFDAFNKTKEKWHNYLKRLKHHMNIYNVMSVNKKSLFASMGWFGNLRTS